jgi:hypothetical protein
VPEQLNADVLVRNYISEDQNESQITTALTWTTTKYDLVECNAV